MLGTLKQQGRRASSDAVVELQPHLLHLLFILNLMRARGGLPWHSREQVREELVEVEVGVLVEL